MKTMMMIAAALALGTTAMADDKMKKPEPKKEEKKAPPKFEAPKPAQELTDMAKHMTGNWTCAGKANMGEWMEFKGMTAKSAVELDKFWIKTEMSGQMGPMKMKGVEYITYDASAKKWHRFSFDNTGGYESNWSSDGKTWVGEMRMMGQTSKTKAVFDMQKPGKEWKVTVQNSPDGKKWADAFEMTCKK